MKEWWLGLQARERKTLIMGGIALSLTLVYFGMWDPFQSNLKQMEQAVEKNQSLLVWMQRSADEVRQLSRSSGSSTRPVKDGRSLLALVDQTAKRGRLGSALKRVEPEGENAVRVWLEKASFDDMMSWLIDIEKKNAVVVSTITIDKQDEPGRVNARITLQGPGA